jgi:intraflagellar transport protein 88
MAIKMYKMALDMAPQKYAALKYKIMKNIAHSYVKMNEFTEASNTYEEILSKFPDLETAYNLMLCLYSLCDKEKMKKNFSEMLNI